jgi:hypothetical protein
MLRLQSFGVKAEMVAFAVEEPGPKMAAWPPVGRRSFGTILVPLRSLGESTSRRTPRAGSVAIDANGFVTLAWTDSPLRHTRGTAGRADERARTIPGAGGRP